MNETIIFLFLVPRIISYKKIIILINQDIIYLKWKNSEKVVE